MTDHHRLPVTESALDEISNLCFALMKIGEHLIDKNEIETGAGIRGIANAIRHHVLIIDAETDLIGE